MFWKLLFLCYTLDAKIIKNINLPSCSNCVHYRPTVIGKCMYFGTKDIQTGEISYNFANSCREDENKCGLEAKYFEQSKYVHFKTLLYSIQNPSPFSAVIIFYTSCFLSYAALKYIEK